MAKQKQQSQHDQLLASLDELLTTNAEELAGTDRLGRELDFTLAVPAFHRILDLFVDLRKASLDRVPPGSLQSLVDEVTHAQEYFKEIRTFSTAQAGAPDKRDSLIEQATMNYERYYTALAPHIAFAIRMGTDFDQLQRDARGHLEEMEALGQGFNEELQRMQDESKSILDMMREAAASSGVAQHHIFFQKEAATQAETSKGWLKATLWLGVGTGVFALIALFAWIFVVVDLTTAQAVQIGIAKLAIFSVLYYGLVWCGRNYHAHRHNFTVNRHRENALSTFEAFVKATDDDATKNAVLLQTTQSIFGPQATGYVQEPERGGSPQILEIFRSMTSRDGGDVG